jgi:Zn-dependent protease
MDIFLIIISYLVFLLSTTFHEASHAFVAKLGGDLTAYHSGQVTLDPMAHIRREPFGMVIMPIIFLFLYKWPFGWASTPYDPSWAREHHRRAALMALAGPMANLLLAVIAGIILKIGLTHGFFDPMDIFGNMYQDSSESSLSGIVRMLRLTFFINLILFVLNLLPLPSLDGSSVIMVFMPKSMANTFSDTINNPGLSLLSLFIAWQIFPYIFAPIYGFAKQIFF